MLKKISFAIVILALLSLFIVAQQEKDDNNAIFSVSEVQEKIDNKQDIYLLDVRTVPEYDGNLGHIEGSVLIPLNELESRLEELEEQKEKEIIVICRSGNRSEIATNILRDKGFNAYNMVGGITGWNGSGYPIVPAGIYNLTVNQTMELLNDTLNGKQTPIDVRTREEWNSGFIDAPWPECPIWFSLDDIKNDSKRPIFMKSVLVKN